MIVLKCCNYIDYNHAIGITRCWKLCPPSKTSSEGIFQMTIKKKVFTRPPGEVWRRLHIHLASVSAVEIIRSISNDWVCVLYPYIVNEVSVLIVIHDAVGLHSRMNSGPVSPSSELILVCRSTRRGPYFTLWINCGYQVDCRSEKKWLKTKRCPINSCYITADC